MTAKLPEFGSPDKRASRARARHARMRGLPSEPNRDLFEVRVRLGAEVAYRKRFLTLGPAFRHAARFSTQFHPAARLVRVEILRARIGAWHRVEGRAS